jgi:hypothetical protein
MQPLNGSTIFRGDQETVRIKVVEPEQTGATLRFVARLFADHPNGSPQVIKSSLDFTISINGSGNVLLAEMKLLSSDTSHFQEKIQLIYDLERTIGSDITTLEQGVFALVPDVAV